MCNSSHISMKQVNDPSNRIPKCNNVVFSLKCYDNYVELPDAISSWIIQLGVNLETYQRSLFQVAQGLKKRYYRLQRQPSRIINGQKDNGNKDSCEDMADVTVENTSGLGISQLSRYDPVANANGVHNRVDQSGAHSKGDNIDIVKKKRSSHSIVRWIRELELYECYDSIPKEGIGLDAASAAVVDSLRLKELSLDDGNKWILDMCCAPGGKLLGMLSSLRRLKKDGLKWNVVALDAVKRRLDVCNALLKKESVGDEIEVSLIHSRAQDFIEIGGRNMLGRFDRVMVDAECTHEGSLRSVLRTLKYWGSQSIESRFTPENSALIISNQRELLRHAINLLKPGGLVIYSTCSLDKEQNELLVSGVLKELDNVMLQQLPTRFCICCSTAGNRTDEWPATSAEPFLREHCPAKYFPDSDKGGVGETDCANLKSPVCVRFSPLCPETDGIFIAGIRKLV